jgi:hypothetical protein
MESTPMEESPTEHGTMAHIPRHLLRSFLPNGFPAPGEPVTDGDLMDLLPGLLRGTAVLLAEIEIAEEGKRGDNPLALALHVLEEQLDWDCWLVERWTASKDTTHGTPQDPENQQVIVV